MKIEPLIDFINVMNECFKRGNLEMCLLWRLLKKLACFIWGMENGKIA